MADLAIYPPKYIENKAIGEIWLISAETPDHTTEATTPEQ